MIMRAGESSLILLCGFLILSSHYRFNGRDGLAQRREFDVVLFGPTGVDGVMAAAHLMQIYPPGSISWAMAGRYSNHSACPRDPPSRPPPRRSVERMARVRDQINASYPMQFIVADALDRGSVDLMVARTRAVLTTVGPFQVLGGPLVAAAAAAGTDYVDIGADPAWICVELLRPSFPWNTYGIPCYSYEPSA